MRIPINAIPKYQGVEKNHSDMADNADIRKAIFGSVPKAVEQTKEFAKYFKRSSSRETCKEIFDFLKQKINYVADGELQLIKLPSALIHTKTGDCKSYSLLTSAILTNLGIPHHFCLVSYNADPTPSHIYVCTDDGCIIDAVWGIFDSEKKPTYKYEVKPNGKMRVKSITGTGGGKTLLGGCGCGCNSCNTMTGVDGYNVRIGAFELDEQSRNFCNNKYPVKKNIFGGDTNKLFREACYLQERAKDEAKEQIKNVTEFFGDLNLKKFFNAPFRAIYLGLIKFNVDGYATKLQNNPDLRAKLERQFTSWGGDGRNVFEAVKDGASKKPIKVGLFTLIKTFISKVAPAGIRINGIGQTDTSKTMTAEEKQKLYGELAKFGMEVKDWSKMSKEEKAAYLSKKIMEGGTGTLIRGSLITAGGVAATAVCSPMNLAAATCTPVGALVGEAVFGFIPDIVKMFVREDAQFDPVADSGDNKGNTGGGSGENAGGGTNDKEKQGIKEPMSQTTMLLIGAAVLGGLYFATKK